MGEYTEEDELVPKWHALDAAVSLYDICIRDVLQIFRLGRLDVGNSNIGG